MAWLVGCFVCSVGNLVYEMKPVATVTDMQMEFIQGTSVALVVMGLLYFAMVGGSVPSRPMNKEVEEGRVAFRATKSVAPAAPPPQRHTLPPPLLST